MENQLGSNVRAEGTGDARAGFPFVNTQKSSSIRTKLESIINRLSDRLVLRGQFACITEEEVLMVAKQCATILNHEPSCLELHLTKPLYIVGDVFGQHINVVNLFKELGEPPKQRYLFLGNYVDRGNRSIELVTLLFAYKLLYPHSVYMLRGNHECPYVSAYYGFLRECRQRHFDETWYAIMNTFHCLPAAAILEDSIFCTHSGIPHDIPKRTVTTREELREYINLSISRPVSLTNNALWIQLTWSEPGIDSRSWRPNPAGLGCLFNEEAVLEFCDRFGFIQMIRAHDWLRCGYEFSADNKLLTVFSMPQMARHNRNTGAVVHLHKRLSNSVIIAHLNLIQIPPINRRTRLVRLRVWDPYLEHSINRVRRSSTNDATETKKPTVHEADSEEDEELKTTAMISQDDRMSTSSLSIGLHYKDHDSLSSVYLQQSTMGYVNLSMTTCFDIIMMTAIIPMPTEREKIIDGFLAWMSVFYAFLQAGILWGTLGTAGLFFPVLIETTGYTTSAVSWIFSCQCAVALFGAPIYNRILDFVPPRLGGCFGGLLVSAAFFATSFVNNFMAIFGMFTVLGGIGIGLTYVRLFAVLAEYLDRYRVLGIAICSSGIGFGMFIYSKLGAYLIDTYTWRPALMFFALLHLNVIPLTIALRPLPPESTPEETVLIPDRPDLMTGNQEDDNKDGGYTSPQRNLFISLYSMTSAKTSVASRAASRPRSRRPTNTAADRVRVVIEFIRVRRSLDPDQQQQNVYIEPSVFVRQLSPIVRQSVERIATPYLLTDSMEDIVVYIPIVYLLAESPLMQRVSGGNQADLIAGSTLRNILRSQTDLLSTTGYQPDSTRRPLRMSTASLVADSFASSTLCMTDQRRLRQALRRTVKQADKRVQNLAAKLRSDGNCAVPQHPVMVLIDSTSQLLYTEQSRISSVNQVRVLGYEGTYGENYSEEGNSEGEVVRPYKPRFDWGQCEYDEPEYNMPLPPRRSISEVRIRLPKKNSTITYLNPIDECMDFGSPVRTRSTEGQWLEPAIERFRKYSRDTDFTMQFIQRSDDAASLLMSKLEVESQVLAEIVDDKPSRGIPSCVLADPLFLCLCCSRTLVVLGDSMFVAHAVLYGLRLGLTQEMGGTFLSLYGLANMIGRFACGLVVQFVQCLEIRSLLTVNFLVASVATIALPFFPSYIFTAIYSFLLGFLTGPGYALSPFLAYDYLGPVRFQSGMPFVMVAESLGLLFGSPVGGLIFEIRNSYTDCLLFSGICMIGSVLLNLFLAVEYHKCCSKGGAAPIDPVR